MMQDDKDLDIDALEDDEFLDSDFDLDDDDLGGDLDIEDLEDLNDEIEDDWDDGDFPASKKTSGSVNKILVYGLIAAFVVGALFVGYQSIAPMFMGGAQNESLQDASLSSVESTSQLVQEAPPMPLPVNNITEEEELSSQAAVLPEESVSVLTPLPSLGSSDEVSSDLPPLIPQDLVEDEPVLGLSVTDEPVSALPVIEKALLSSEDNRASEEVVRENAAVQEAEIEALVVSQVEKRLDDTEAALDQEIGMMASRLSAHDVALEKIMASLARIEDELSAQKKAIKAAGTVKKVAVSVPVKKKSVRKVPKKKPILHNNTSKPKVSKKKSWVLKSAQPGRAVIAEVGTNYLRSVEVGSTLSGIGKITSISNETGRWVVWGSQGRISQ